MIRSLRIRLLLGTSIASAILLALLGGTIFVAMTGQLMADYESGLLARARIISAAVEQHGDHVQIDEDATDVPEFSRRVNPDYFELWAGDQVIRRSPSLQGHDLPRTKYNRLMLPGAHHARSVVLTFAPNREDEGEAKSDLPPQTCTLAVAGTPVAAYEMLERLGWLLLITCTAAIVASGLVLLWIVSRGVRPVREMSDAIGRVRESALGDRLTEAGLPTELLPIARTLNGLLDRLEKAFTREKAFTADVAHELRTPLAGLMTTLEVCRSRPRTPGEFETAIDESRAMIDRMQAMVQNLLLLSRAENGQLPVSRTSVDAAVLLRETWTLFAARADERQLKIEWSIADHVYCEADAAYLQIIVQNLFDNAVSYADERGTVRIAAGRTGDDAMQIEIANTGNHLSPADAACVFDRFWRGDASRQDTSVHCGLGMSLAQRLARLLAGEIAVEVAGDVFTARLRLPHREGV